MIQANPQETNKPQQQPNQAGTTPAPTTPGKPKVDEPGKVEGSPNETKSTR